MLATSAATRPLPATVDTTSIDERYRIERVLGRGGMGEVLAVVEPSTGARFALKRLLPSAKPRHALLLQREFHTLSSLKHPHIVQAFDYGSSEGVPYYTMELLDGNDVDSLAPLPWTEVVAILRDVASALSLIHARHLVHRDVGARNVWRTSEGVVKLIDFGALTSFGASSDLAGTPPYVAPEALRTHVLDQRTDLYALGALAYFLLTGRHAYPARNLAELERYWAEGAAAPNARMAEQGLSHLPTIPEPLEQLIEALMAAAPAARPVSAAEVLDRLDDVLPGSAAISDVALAGVLASKAFVGRDNERRRLRFLLKRALAGAGASVALLGPRGIGRSRLLSELAIEARLAGAHVIQVSGDGERTALAAAGRATLKLFETAPSLARACAAPHAAVLGHLSPALREVLGLGTARLERFPELAGEGQLRLQAALQRFWLELTSDKPLVLLLDDLQSMDSASRTLFTTLACEAPRSQLLVVASVRSRPDASLPPAARMFAERSMALTLGGLLQHECSELLRSIFGDAEHLSRNAQHLAERAEGNPGRLMELCEYLVSSSAIRCIDGIWLLPQELSELTMPASLAQLDEARLARASADAQELACALSVMQRAVPLELCSALSPLPKARMFPALDELCACGVSIQSESGYVFRSDTLRTALVSRLDAGAVQRAHVTAGEALLALERPSVLQRMEAGVHLLQGGSSRRGAEIMHHALIDVLKSRPEEHAEVAQLTEQALGYVRELGLSEAEQLSFLCILSWGGYFVDRRLGFSFGDQALACAERVCGMTLARRLAPWLGRKLGLYVALVCAGIALRRQSKHSALVPDLKTAILMMTTAAGSLAGMYTLCVARDKVLESGRAIEPLTALGPDHGVHVVYQFVMGCAGTIGDRPSQTRQHWARLMARLDDPRPIKGLDASTRDYYAAATMYASGSGEYWRDESRTLEIADRLERQPLKLYQLSADQLRAQHYAHQGNLGEVARHRARVEMHALQRGMTWQVEISAPCVAVSVATRQRDALALKRAANQLSQLGVDTPSLRSWVDYARASYLLLRRRPAQALELLESLLQQHRPEQIGHANIVGLLAQAYNALERFGDAERASGEVLAQLNNDDLAYPGLTLRLQIEHALAIAGLGRHEQAAAQLDALITQHTRSRGPLTLGALHDARASVALRAKQDAVARQHVEHMERWYRSTDCPGLIQHCDRVAKRWETRRSYGRDDVSSPPSTSFLATIGERLTSTQFQESPQELVVQLVRGATAIEGVLAYVAPDGLRHVVQSRDEELPKGLGAWLEQRVNAALSYATESDEAAGNQPVDPNVISLEGQTWRLFLLVSEHGTENPVLGAVALCNPASEVPLDVLRAVAQRLQADSKPVTTRDS